MARLISSLSPTFKFLGNACAVKNDSGTALTGRRVKIFANHALYGSTLSFDIGSNLISCIICKKRVTGKWPISH